MSVKVGINGFGRIGRAIFRKNMENNHFNIVCINDINPDIDNIAYLLKYDTVYGKCKNQISTKGNYLLADGKPSRIFHEKSIKDVQWDIEGVDIVIDASGISSNLDKAIHLKEINIRCCIFTNSPLKEKVDKTIIMGVNENTLNLDHDFLIAASICDANAFVPVVNVLDREFGIDHGFLTTLHPWLGYQNLLDGPSVSYASPGDIYDHYALGRSSFGTIIPKTTSAINATCNVLENMKGKFLSFSYRVPTMIVGSADASINLKNNITIDDIKNLFIKEAKNQKYKIFKNNIKNLISSDFIRSEYSAIIDHRWLMVNNQNYLKIVLWYDNEWGYSSRVVDLINYIGKIS
jgi:glyceraldehyde 3-phosphate dehydrogenase